MRTAYSLAGLLASTVLVAGCLGSSAQPVRVPPTSDTRTTAETTAVATVYEVGEEAAAGDILHTVTLVEQMDVIPASATLPEWEIIAEDTPASEGFTWLHIVGEVTNNSKESQTVTSGSVYVTDADDNQFDVSTDTTLYVDSDKSPIYLSLQPTQTIEWEGYFMVPADATDLVFVGNDLSFLPEDEVRIDLGL